MAIVQKWKLGQANTLVGTQTVVGTLYPVNSKLHVITVNAGGSTSTTTPRGNIIPDSGYTGGVIESIIDEVAPLAYWTTDSTVADQANIFVNEHHHIIDLQKYESFTGFNFWLVHLLKYINFSTHIRFTGNTILIILGSGICFMLHRFKTSSQTI